MWRVSSLNSNFSRTYVVLLACNTKFDERRIIEESASFGGTNFGFQNTVEVNYTISKGDSLSTHCVYDTSKSKEKVTFGLESEQEMCMDFVFYYPKENTGLACGFIKGGITYCKDRLIRNKKKQNQTGKLNCL